MSVCLLLISDGRDDYKARTLASLRANVPHAFADCVEVEDPEHVKGFCGAIQEGWSRVLQTGCDFCFWLEADYTFNRPIPIEAMQGVLERYSYLVQMALLRQPWNERERAAGGIIQEHPEDYFRMEDGEHCWMEHRRFVTTNPALWPTWVMRAGWPQEPESEGKFGLNLFASNPNLRSAFWGDGSEWVQHIGVERVGVGY